MGLRIVWTENALEDFHTIVDYLLKNWSYPVSKKFIQIVQKRVTILSGSPTIGVAFRKFSDVRSIVLTRHNKLYYSYDEETLTVLNIFDSRQDPSKNKFD